MQGWRTRRSRACHVVNCPRRRRGDGRRRSSVLSPVLGLVPSLSSVLKLALVTGIGKLRGWRPRPQNDRHRDRRLIVAIAIVPLEFIVAVAIAMVASRGRHRHRGRCRSRRLAIAIAVVYHHCTVRIGPQSK